MSEVRQCGSDVWIGGGLRGCCAFTARRVLRIGAQVSGPSAGYAFLPVVMAILARSIWLS